MLYYSLQQKAKVLAGAGTVNKIGEVIQEAGYKKPLLVYDEGIAQCGIADKVIGSIREAQIEYAIFDRVVPNPPDDVINEGGRLCKEWGCDCVIAVGGGSSIDTAKGIAVLQFNPGHDILDFADMSVTMNTCSGIISIPTTSGTGSELSNGIIVSNHLTDEKVPIVAYNAMSDVVILDAELTIGMPKGLTAITGLDVFSHAWEAYTTVLCSPVVEPVLEKVMQEVVTYLPRAIADGTDLEARERMLIAASLGGWGLFNCCANVGHSLGHVLGGVFHLPHGAACAYGAPAALKHVALGASKKIQRVGEILGATFDGSETPEQIGTKTAAAYITFRDEVVGLKPLSTYHLNPEDVIAVAPKVAVECFAQFTPVPVTVEAATIMLKEIVQSL